VCRAGGKNVAGSHRDFALGGANPTVAGADDEEFPLGEMEVVGADGGAGRDAADLHVERMPAV